ncbi:CPBP family intramembrane metalloprotease [Romboutsia weinsteinii]|uniref:CPBP family intramembrane metalloprotease n=1 Tax=Romboutsia weinsteinii TaxID=2020949 RepID=A0A371IYC2_9FIRM|nr:CPBP family intramembrane glutamic endopeptidase [Romboutsia weinsteinii]RDY25482.1 CPBP family intramembrane metalloprotease [Romboutsia weinsteinii]
MDFSNIGFVVRGTIMQLILFMSIPFVWWTLKYRKESSFFRWMGVYKPSVNKTINSAIYIIILYCIIWILLHSSMVSKLIGDGDGLFYKMGSKAIIPCFIVAFFQNGLCEELFSRGFLLKRLLTKFSFTYANILQAFLFAMLHIAIGGSGLPLFNAVALVIKTFIGGWILGYISEKEFRGSIIPGVILHGLGNFITYLINAFL